MCLLILTPSYKGHSCTEHACSQFLNSAQLVQAVEADCATLGALLKGMLGLLSKPHAAAHLLSSEAHSYASTSTALPAAPTLPPNADTADASQIADPQATSASHAPGTESAEALEHGSWPSGTVAQPLLAEPKHTMSQAAASDAAAREGGAPEYQHTAWQSPAGPGAAQSAPQAAPDNALVAAQLPASEPQLGTHTQSDTQAPAGAPTTGKTAKQRGGGKGSKAHRLGGQLTGSAAHALAVLQAGPPSRSMSPNALAGECLSLQSHCFTQEQMSSVLL